jgi:hypothetical protein
MAEGSTPLLRQYAVPRLKYLGHIVALTVLGFLSGLATIASFHYGETAREEFFNLKGGGVFGTVLALYLFLFRGLRSPVRALLLVLTSIVAYNLAETVGMLDPLFFSGALGASLVVAAVLFLISPDQTGLVIFRYALVFGVGGGFLGALGSALGPSLGERVSLFMDKLGLYPHFDFDGHELCSVFPVWQAGMGAFFGVLFWVLDKKVAEQAAVQQSRLTTTAKIFFGGMVGLSSWAAFAILAGK